jgi:hypothetical protein
MLLQSGGGFAPAQTAVLAITRNGSGIPFASYESIQLFPTGGLLTGGIPFSFWEFGHVTLNAGDFVSTSVTFTPGITVSPSSANPSSFALQKL